MKSEKRYEIRQAIGVRKHEISIDDDEKAYIAAAKGIARDLSEVSAYNVTPLEVLAVWARDSL